jgi:hypothetical protein
MGALGAGSGGPSGRVPAESPPRSTSKSSAESAGGRCGRAGGGGAVTGGGGGGRAATPGGRPAPGGLPGGGRGAGCTGGRLFCEESGEPGSAAASPVSSAMPKRSFACRRGRGVGGTAAPPGRRGASGGALPDRPGGRAEGGSVAPCGGTFRGALPGGGGAVRGAGFPPIPASSAGSTACISCVVPVMPSVAGLSSPPFLTWKTFLQAVQRTRTPRSVTFSSAIRNFDVQFGHWTTTCAYSRLTGTHPQGIFPEALRPCPPSRRSAAGRAEQSSSAPELS